MAEYTNFRTKTFPNMSFKEFIRNSPFEKPYNDYESVSTLPSEGASCVPGCDFKFTKPYNFERHIQTVHSVLFLNHITRLLAILGIAYPGSSNQSQQQYLDVSDFYFDSEHSESYFDTYQYEHEIPFDDEFENKTTEDDISYVHSNSHIDSSGHSSKFFDNLSHNLDHVNFNYVKRICDSILLALTETNITMEALTTVSKRILIEVFDHPKVGIDKDVIESIQRIVSSKDLIESYVKTKETFVQPEPIIINGIEVGQYVSIKKQAAIMLKNKSLVKSIISKDQNSFPVKSEFYNSELACCKERRSLLLGKLRIELGADDFSVTTSDRQFFICYCSFTNIPIEERLKRKDTFLVVVAGRDEMAKANATIGDLLDKLVEDLKELEQIGIPVIIESQNGVKQTKMIKCVLSSVTGDNKGEVELLGLKKGFYKGFICRHCGTGLDEMQTKLDNFTLFSNEDINEYNEDVARAKEKQQEMKEAEEENGGQLSKYMQLKYRIESKFGVVTDCIFNTLLCFSIFLNTPPDVLHDLAQGCIPRFLDLILRNIVFLHNNQRLSLEEIKSRLCAFPFINGKLQMSLKRNKAGIEQFHFHAKAVLKVEVLARLEEVFHSSMQRDFTNIGYILFRTLFDFCSIAFSFSINDSQLEKMDRDAKKLIEYTRSIRSEELLDDEELVGDDDELENINNDFDLDVDCNQNICQSVQKKKIHAVYSKLHTLLHYSDLTRRYGPLVLFSTLKYERKHVFFKNLASIMRNYKNPCFTFAKRHQMFMVLTLEKTNFFQMNLFDNLTGECRISSIKPEGFLTESTHKLMRTFEYYIPSPSKNVLRKLLIPRVDYWIHIKNIWTDSNKNTFAEGQIYKLIPRTKRNLIGNVNSIRGSNFECLEPYSATGDMHSINIRHLHYRKDFMFCISNQSSNVNSQKKKKKNQDDIDRVLFRGLM